MLREERVSPRLWGKRKPIVAFSTIRKTPIKWGFLKPFTTESHRKSVELHRKGCRNTRKNRWGRRKPSPKRPFLLIFVSCFQIDKKKRRLLSIFYTIYARFNNRHTGEYHDICNMKPKHIIQHKIYPTHAAAEAFVLKASPSSSLFGMPVLLLVLTRTHFEDILYY